MANCDRRAVRTCFDEGRRWLVVRRGRFSTLANFSEEDQAVPLPESGSVALSSEEGPGRASTEGLRLPAGDARLAPFSVVVVAR